MSALTSTHCGLTWGPLGLTYDHFQTSQFPHDLLPCVPLTEQWDPLAKTPYSAPKDSSSFQKSWIDLAYRSNPRLWEKQALFTSLSSNTDLPTPMGYRTLRKKVSLALNGSDGTHPMRML